MPWLSTQMTGLSYIESKCQFHRLPSRARYHHFNVLIFSSRFQHYSTTYTPQNSERQRERQRGLVKQTFELDEAAVHDRQDDQVVGCVENIYCFKHSDAISVSFRVISEVKGCWKFKRKLYFFLNFHHLIPGRGD